MCVWVDGGIRIGSVNIVPWIEYINFGFSSSFSLFRFSSRVVECDTHIGVPSSASIIFIDCYNSSNFRCRKERAVSERLASRIPTCLPSILSHRLILCVRLSRYICIIIDSFSATTTVHTINRHLGIVYLILWGFLSSSPWDWNRLQQKSAFCIPLSSIGTFIFIWRSACSWFVRTQMAYGDSAQAISMPQTHKQSALTHFGSQIFYHFIWFRLPDQWWSGWDARKPYTCVINV